MKKQYFGCRVFFFVSAAFMVFGSMGCYDGQNNTTNVENQTIQSKPVIDKQLKANPAVVKCIEDGFELEPIMENGIQIGHKCRNPNSGMECEVWQYFREECLLE